MSFSRGPREQDLGMGLFEGAAQTAWACEPGMEPCVAPGELSKRASSGDDASSAQTRQHMTMAGQSEEVQAPPAANTAAEHASTPAWIPLCLGSTFFGPCEQHRHLKKNECTYFCTTCATRPVGLCQHCMCHHQNHQVIQVRRYVYCDVVRAMDINPFVDVTGIQAYIINQAKVVFLNARPQAKFGQPGDPECCRTCSRNLREGFTYCCVACKVQAIEQGVDLAGSHTTSSPSSDASNSVGPPLCDITPTPRSKQHAASMAQQLPRQSSGSSDSSAFAAVVAAAAAASRVRVVDQRAPKPAAAAKAGVKRRAEDAGPRRSAPGRSAGAVEIWDKPARRDVPPVYRGQARRDSDDSSSCEPEEVSFPGGGASGPQVCLPKPRRVRYFPQTDSLATGHADECDAVLVAEEGGFLHPAQQLAAVKRRRSSFGGSRANSDGSVGPEQVTARSRHGHLALPGLDVAPLSMDLGGFELDHAASTPLLQLFMAAGGAAPGLGYPPLCPGFAAPFPGQTFLPSGLLQGADVAADPLAMATGAMDLGLHRKTSLPGTSRRKQGAPQRSRDA